jgi:bifunctional non-homologous end joining protein LigD
MECIRSTSNGQEPDMATTGTGKVTRVVDGREIRLTSLGKTMYPDTGFTKQGVADYYTADVLLPQLSDRPVTRIRYPEGVGGERFFEKHTQRSTPEWIRRFTVSASPGTGKEAKQVRYPVIDNLAGLLWMANQAALELHTPQWRLGPRGGVRKPDRLVIDLDPGEGAGLDDCAEVAHFAAERLREDGLRVIPVTSGSKGIHLYVPVDGRRTALAIHEYVMRLARELAAAHPERIVAVQGKAERVGKVMIDWSQNHPARSTATPYTLRGRTNPTVAAPRRWEEIAPGLAQLSPEEVVARLREDGDLMEEEE